MSFKRLAAVVFAAALTLGLTATAGARPAFKHHKFHRTPGCSISMYAQPAQIMDGEAVELYGQLTCGGKAVAAKSVAIRARTSPNHWKLLGTTTTTELGTYAVDVPYVNRDVNFQAVAAGVAQSRLRPVRVTPIVTFNGPAEGTTLYTGKAHAVTFSGFITPSSHGATVVLQREESSGPENWHAIQYAKTKAHGFYVFVHRFVVPGSVNLRVVVRPYDHFNTRGISNSLSYGISQTENPALTIHTSSTSVSPGSTVTISGVTSAGEKATVSLYGRSTLGGRLKFITSEPAGPGGAYSFTETVSQNMLFQTRVGTTDSALLFQGARYGLSLTTSFPATLASGAKLTVEGTVTGAPVGHPVYLERENRFGHGFHVIAVAGVTSSDTFTLEGVLIGSGKTVVRVKVPGAPGHQDAVSSTATIELTPTPPSLTLPTPTPVLGI
ncbi:MAG TPA: hypothetical protein VMA83_08750 [Solirubrobacteraceae bacterium]|nr:hypothetical protein [Solirubrobacteraceae bacterium]